jgi:hypothetical protein
VWPFSSVSVVSSVTVPPCASTMRWTSRRVSPTSLLASETVPVAMIARCSSGLAAGAVPVSASDPEPEVSASVEPSPRLDAPPEALSAASAPPSDVCLDDPVASPALSLAEQAARRAVMVIAVRTPAARRRVVARVVMALGRGSRRGRFRP